MRAAASKILALAPDPMHHSVVSHSLREQLNASLGAAYTIERELGSGGMATVFLAQDLKHDRHSFGHTHHTYYNIACAYAVLRDKDKAMAWLERSVDTGFACWPFFRVDPHLESLREEPAFQRLVADLELTYSALEIQRL